MPALPSQVLASLDEVDGNNCGSLSHELALVPNADPPVYNKVLIGDFAIGRCAAIMDGDDIVDWELTIRYINPGHSCQGLHIFRLTTPDSDPRGAYCKRTTTGTDCSAAEATVTDCV